jgi:competence protein ComEA
LVWLNGSFTNLGIPAQTGQWKQEKGQEKTNSAETDNFVSPAGSEKININLASLEELQTLPGIGLVTAKRIVDYRKKNPPFRKVEELLIIRGISKNRLEQIRNRIRVN